MIGNLSTIRLLLWRPLQTQGEAWFDMYYSLHIYLKLNFDCSTHSNIVLAVAMINKICKTEIIILFWGSFWRLQTNNVVVNDYLVRATVVTSFVCRNIIDFDFFISDAEIDMLINKITQRFTQNFLTKEIGCCFWHW